ncbi:hypothetical protein H257_15909 [Aphanomyces astaci]|uniref:Uncharacterized protein n=1 Tax=Aphanomyces astaci TaxID=112090 RepID=W4FKB2_APHAT|nr:hypothetical protein H257_15909 [Aphanomyces astaci]ETV67920.1 hypothetical protein H257_15909 [Aphanomyces astaci]|eukprot:XP_009842483.1 hypothetical protein H257_15909 [Aphanomyces astaci]
MARGHVVVAVSLLFGVATGKSEIAGKDKVNVWDVSFWVLVAALVCYMAKRLVTIYDACHPNKAYRHDDFKYVNFYTHRINKPKALLASST